jgi:hypothetical protein
MPIPIICRLINNYAMKPFSHFISCMLPSPNFVNKLVLDPGNAAHVRWHLHKRWVGNVEHNGAFKILIYLGVEALLAVVLWGIDVGLAKHLSACSALVAEFWRVLEGFRARNLGFRSVKFIFHSLFFALNSHLIINNFVGSIYLKSILYAIEPNT